MNEVFWDVVATVCMGLLLYASWKMPKKWGWLGWFVAHCVVLSTLILVTMFGLALGVGQYDGFELMAGMLSLVFLLI